MYNYGYINIYTGGVTTYMKKFYFSFGVISLLIIFINIIDTLSGYTDNTILFISNPILRFLAHNDILKTSGVTYYLFNTNDVYLSYGIHLASFILFGALIDFIIDIYQKLNLTKNYR